MVIFLDQEKRIKVIRVTTDASGKAVRESLGAVTKRDMEIPAKLEQTLNREEMAQLKKALDVYRSSRASLMRYQAQSFPVIVREVVDYFETCGDEVERGLIAAAVLEGLRRIRAMEREQASSANAPAKASKGNRAR